MRDALNRWERFGYDRNSNLRKRVDAAQSVTYYTYDEVNRRTETKRPDGGYAYFRYDAVGKMVAARDEQGWTYFGYDAVNRVTGVTPPWGSRVAFGYDAAGRRRKVQSDAGCPYYTYDGMGRLTQVIDSRTAGWGNQPYGTSWYGGALTDVVTADYEWDAASRMTKQAQGNGQVTYFVYDRANRLTARKSILPDGRALTYFEYAYDAASRITKINREGGRTAYYAYDDANRLTGEHWYSGSGTPSIYAFEWSYDPAGNRIGELRNGVTTQYNYDAANELHKAYDATAVQTTYFEYDPNGNCKKIVAVAGMTYFAYDSRNLQTRITYRTGVSNYFRYDALGRRTALVDSAGAAYFTYDADGLCHLVERNAAGTVVAKHTRGIAPVPGIGDLVASKVYRDNVAYFQYQDFDHRGNLQRIVNQNGVVTAYFEYDAWGRYLRNTPPPEGTRFGPSAPAWIILKDDPDNVFAITPTRTAHRGIGRFLQRDHLRLEGGYGMFLQSPMLIVDANGLVPMLTDGTGNSGTGRAWRTSTGASPLSYQGSTNSSSRRSGDSGKYPFSFWHGLGQSLADQWQSMGEGLVYPTVGPLLNWYYGGNVDWGRELAGEVYDKSALGQSANKCEVGAGVYYGTRAAIGVGTVAALIAGGVGAAEYFLLANESIVLGWRGGELTFTVNRVVNDSEIANKFLRINFRGDWFAENPLGRPPHWHWRSPRLWPPAPGGGIGRHLPWEWFF